MSLKYTRLCDTCRNNREYRNLQPCSWTSWGDKEPTCGTSLEGALRLV